jgi:protein-S-isoprenylcysteine O-methyltransferase Ste14
MNRLIDYFQISALVIVIFVVFAKAAYLKLARNINAFVIAGGYQGLKQLIEPIAMFVFVIWLVELLLYLLHSSFRIFTGPLQLVLLSSLTAKLVGVALIAVGVVILILAYITFGDSWRVGFDVRSPGTLVTKGIFAVTRNPIYLFLDLWFVGTFLINGALIFLLYAIAEMAAIHWQIRQEEHFLSKLYGESYREYCKRTPRYLIW